MPNASTSVGDDRQMNRFLYFLIVHKSNNNQPYINQLCKLMPNLKYKQYGQHNLHLYNKINKLLTNLFNRANQNKHDRKIPKDPTNKIA